MSRLNTLHLHDVEAVKLPTAEPGSSRGVAAIVTAVVVLLAGGALFLMMQDSPPRTVPTEAEAVGAPIAPAGANPPLTPEQVGSTVAVPAGTKLSLEITSALSSADAVVGKEIVATLAAPVSVDGAVALPAGSKVVGRVTETLEISATDGNGIFGVAFDRIEIDGSSTPIVAELKGERLDLAQGRRLEIELTNVVEVPATATTAVEAETPATSP
jgi:hypothetical protein